MQHGSGCMFSIDWVALRAAHTQTSYTSVAHKPGFWIRQAVFCFDTLSVFEIHSKEKKKKKKKKKHGLNALQDNYCIKPLAIVAFIVSFIKQKRF